MRAMTVADIDVVLEIEKSVQAYPWTRGNFSDAMKSGCLCYVEEEEGKPCAYAVLMPGVDEAQLLNIGVAKDRQRKGMGSAMLDAMLKKAAELGFTKVLLEVRASNLAALSLYKRAGFVMIGLRRAYYRDEKGCEDAIVMSSGAAHG